MINPADLMKTHISGIINHGENKFNTYIDVGQYQHDPNLTVNLLIKTLLKIAARQVGINLCILSIVLTIT